MSRVRSSRERLAAAFRWHPEWPLVAIWAAAWLVLISGVSAHHGEGAVLGAQPFAICILSTPDAGEAAQLHSGEHGADDGDVVVDLSHWTLMAVAMMAPIGFPAGQHVGLNSIRRRRLRALTLYFGGFVGLWVLLGGLVLSALGLVRGALGLDLGELLAISLTGAALWQLSRWKRRAIYTCKRTVPLPPVGLRADLACARFGLKHGWRCLVSSGGLMVVMALALPASLAWMVALSAFVAVEELTVLGRRLIQPAAVVLALAAALALVV